MAKWLVPLLILLNCPALARDSLVNGLEVVRTVCAGKVIEGEHRVSVVFDKPSRDQTVTSRDKEVEKLDAVTEVQEAAADEGGEKVGIWTDSTSGLTWQVTPTGGKISWSDAKSHCAGLSLAGGDWRLPTIDELRSLIRGCPATQLEGGCNVKKEGSLSSSSRDSLCNGCSFEEGSGKKGLYWPVEVDGEPLFWYWSSSPVEDNDHYAWNVSFNNGSVNYSVVVIGIQVRCVR